MNSIPFALEGSVRFSSNLVTLYHGDAAKILDEMPPNSVDCVVTSPPYYGQRDYGVKEQLGLEPSPQLYIDRLIDVFTKVKNVLKPSGSLWVNIGDTYWSGKGTPKGDDAKQKHRRFARPQDRKGSEPWCVPKQLLLIPHRLAIGLQESGWIVRNDNVWHKLAPTPDPVDDRCSLVHEYVFHFVKQRKYYFDHEAVAVPSNGDNVTKPPPSVWTLPKAVNKGQHQAIFPPELVMLPIRATCPPNGILLDPFCGTGTALQVAVEMGEKRRSIGIDISEKALAEATQRLSGNNESIVLV